MIDIRYDGFPFEQEQEIKGYMEQIDHLLPGWVNLLVFENLGLARNDDDASAAACIQSDVEYRKATITVLRGFWDGCPEDRLFYIIHETCHLVSEPLCQYLEQILELVCDEVSESVAKMLREQYRVAVESMTQDMAISQARMINDQN